MAKSKKEGRKGQKGARKGKKSKEYGRMTGVSEVRSRRRRLSVLVAL